MALNAVLGSLTEPWPASISSQYFTHTSNVAFHIYFLTCLSIILCQATPVHTNCENCFLLQVDPMDGLSSSYEPAHEPHRQFGGPLSRIQSVDPAFDQAACSLEETEKLKSIRVMDWIRGDLTLEPSSAPDSANVHASLSPISPPPLPVFPNRCE